ncbi:hypothetical protein EGI22_03055 [Lacihabitans sp. LS3-19]|nr:hypothetical protein [Lacihabitans sp. LS3-19]
MTSQAQRKDNPNERAMYEYKITKDPKTGIVPRDELEKARGIMSKMIKLMGAVPNVTWSERGPNNIGGRTRALMWDPNDATAKKVWAGGASGGLWYNNDITNANSSWIKVDDFWDNIAISCIAYDPNNTQIMYVGTGERGSSSVGNTGNSATGGGGIWKTSDGGTTWARLTNTIPNYAANASGQGLAFREIQKIVVNSSGDVFAGTWGGLFKSINNGTGWTLVTGNNAPTEPISDLEIGFGDILYVGVGGIYSDVPPQVIKSTSSAANDFVDITPAGSFANGRVELALAPSTSAGSQRVYALGAWSDGIRFFTQSSDAGGNWQNMAIPLYDDLNGGGEKPFVGNQGDYDLILGTHLNDPDILYTAGITFSISKNAGASWLPKLGYSDIGNMMHVDNHSFAARPGFSNEAVFGNDGGVYYSANWGSSPSNTYPTFQKRNKNYNVTQFFSVDINSYANNSSVIAGSQDNGTQTLSSAYGTVGSGYEINSGDGGLCFIDKLDSNIVISNYTNVSPKLNFQGIGIDNAVEMQPQFSDRGQFINPADYDSPNHTLYHNSSVTSETDTKIFRYHIAGTSPNYTYTTSTLTIQGQGALDISFLKLGKTAGNLYIGTTTGDVFKVTGVNTAGNQTLTTITKIMDKTNTSEGNVSCIDFGLNENMIVVTKSNYNIASVFHTTNAGANWISKDETGYGLPNVPIRYALINPVDPKQVLLATELGVWSSSDITVSNPQWAPTNANLANVRCDMLKFRASDNTLAVATHGRGVFTTKINQSGSPCPTTLVLISTTNDLSTGATTFQANETIKASNIISGDASVVMKAGNSIELAPSQTGGGTTFEAKAGTVFHAYIQGCME